MPPITVCHSHQISLYQNILPFCSNRSSFASISSDVFAIFFFLKRIWTMSKLRIYFNHCKICSRNEQVREFLLIFQQNFLIWKIIYLVGLSILKIPFHRRYETIVSFSTNLNKRNKQLYPSYSLLILIKHYTQFYTSQNTYNI